MRFLRRISTRRLVTLCATIVAVAVAGAAIALAATAGGPTPPPKPLARAIHDALAAPPVQGVSARIRFTNHLIDKSSLGEGADPLLTGATGRLWASREGKLRIELQSDGGAGDSQILVDKTRFTIYDAGANTVYRGTLPQHRGSHEQHAHRVPTVRAIQRELTRLMGDVTLSGARPGDIAGRPAYTVRITPKRDAGLLGAAELAWDATTGVPLRAAVFAKGDTSPVLELKATDISYGRVAASTFAIQPPSGAKVVDLTARDIGHAPLQTKLPFRLDAPATLAGMRRSSVRLIASDEHPAALVTYGRGPGGIAVIESQAQPQPDRGPALGGLQLPSVSIGGVTGAQELDTALGTAITFTRGGIDYVVLGSVAPSVARAAARGL
jgi:outer membrane lipoprotein-sorting protein